MHSVVFLDNQEITRQIARRILEKNNFRVYAATSGKEGLGLIEQVQPDVVVTDLFMPQMGGIEVIKHVNSHLSRTPVIAICRFKEAPYLKVAKHLGAFSGLCKPFSEAELLMVIHDALRVGSIA